MRRPTLLPHLLAVLGCVAWLHAPWALASESHGFPPDDRARPVTADALPAIHAEGIAHLQAAVGRARTQRLLSAAAELAGGGRIVAACVGSFDRPGPSQVVLGLASADLSRLVYAAFLEDQMPQVLWEEQPRLDKPGVLPRFPSARCLSWTAVERENSARIAAEAQPTVQRRSVLDVACVAPMQSDWAFVCYAPDDRRRPWVRLGGWVQP